jgi:hypothetical protein
VASDVGAGFAVTTTVIICTRGVGTVAADETAVAVSAVAVDGETDVACGPGAGVSAGGTGVAVGSGVGVAVGAGVRVGVGVAVGRGVDVGSGVGVSVGVGVGIGVAVGKGVGVGSGVGVSVGVGVGVGVAVGRGVGVGVGIGRPWLPISCQVATPSPLKSAFTAGYWLEAPKSQTSSTPVDWSKSWSELSKSMRQAAYTPV